MLQQRLIRKTKDIIHKYSKVKLKTGVLALLLLLLPVSFWLTVLIEPQGGLSWLNRIWSLLPHPLLYVLIPLLSTPPLFVGILSLKTSLRNDKNGLLISLIAIAAGVVFLLLAFVAVL